MAALSPPGDLAATWSPGAGTIAVLRDIGGSWQPAATVRTSVGDVTHVLPDSDEQVVTVVGAGGALEVVDIGGAQLLFRRDLELVIPGDSQGATVRWASAAAASTGYTVHLGLGHSTGAVTAGVRVTLPLQIAALRARLCEIQPTATTCRPRETARAADPSRTGAAIAQRLTSGTASGSGG